MRIRLLSLAVLVALAACGERDPATAPASGASSASTAAAAADDGATTHQELAALFDEYWEASLELNPLQATFIGDPRYNDRLPNFLSAEHMEKSRRFEQQWLDRASAIDAEGLSEQDRISLEIFLRDRRNNLDGDRFPGELIPLNQFWSFAAFAAVLGSGTSAQPFVTVQDYDNWLARAGQLPVLFDQSIVNMREGMTKGIVQPKVLMEKVLPQLEAHIVEDVEKSVFWGPVAKLPEDASEADRERLTAAYRALIAEQLVPAYTRLRDFVHDEYLPAARDTVGLSALPGGDEWYAFNVRSSTTTDMTPEQIHQIGLDEVARIQGEMRAVMQEVGFDGELKDFFKHLTTSKEFKFASEEALLESYNGLRAQVEAGVPALFSRTPKAAFEIRPVEAFRAASQAGGSYQGPSEDGTRPGIFYVNTYDLPSRKTWDMESLFLHEAIPGHHFQIALAGRRC